VHVRDTVEQVVGKILGPQGEVGAAIGEHRAVVGQDDDAPGLRVRVAGQPGVDPAALQGGRMAAQIRQPHATGEAHGRAESPEPGRGVGARAAGMALHLRRRVAARDDRADRSDDEVVHDVADDEDHRPAPQALAMAAATAALARARATLITRERPCVER
jgi:hypothetical protein